MRQDRGTYMGLDHVMKGRGSYVQHTALKGETALLRDHAEPEKILAQFDDLENLPSKLTHGWTEFPRKDFYIHPVEKEGEPYAMHD